MSVDLFGLLLKLAVLTWVLYGVIRNNHLEKVLLRVRFIPKYKQLISQYNAKYPCVMECVSTCDTSFNNLKGIYDLKSYIFIKDEAFVIISTENPDIYVEIPFKSIIYHNTSSDSNISNTYQYRSELFFKIDNDIECFLFWTLRYNHKLCKKYPDLLCDDQLFDFVCKNFKTRKEYRGW